MAKKQKQNNKRRLLLLILLLVCALVLLGGATYAWFTANTKVAIEQMQLEVQVANGIEISADAKNWGPRVTLDQLRKAGGLTVAGEAETAAVAKIEDAGSVNQFPKYLDHVSSIGNIKEDNNRLDLINGTASSVCHVGDVLKGVASEDFRDGIDIGECDDDPTYGIVASSPYDEGTESCNGELVTGNDQGCDKEKIKAYAFDIYLKLDNDSKVALADGSYVKNKKGTVDYGLKNTIRVAFITLGTQPASFYYANPENIGTGDNAGKLVTKEGSTETLVADTDGTGNTVNTHNYVTNFGGYVGTYGARHMNSFGGIDIWEPNANAHSDSGINNSIHYGLTGSDALEPSEAIVTNGLIKPITPAEKLPIAYADADPDANPEFFAAQKSVTTVATPYKNPINYIKSSYGEFSRETATNAGDNPILFIGARGVTKMRIYIWVEGNDVDTENTATSSQIETLLSFTTAGGSLATGDTFESYSTSKDPIYNTKGTTEGGTNPHAPKPNTPEGTA